jgi:catechol 2,3-dioxygenase-like lactoylglutathione lyase family enzyme
VQTQQHLVEDAGLQQSGKHLGRGAPVPLARRLPLAMIAHIFLGDDKEALMSIVLDHTIVPARDKEGSARFFARIFGLEYKGPVSHFAPVKINDTLTIDFDDWDSFERHHYAFKVSEAEFDGIFDRVRGEGLVYGSGPRSAEDMEINHRRGGRGFYFRDPNGHLLEVLTA